MLYNGENHLTENTYKEGASYGKFQATKPTFLVFFIVLADMIGFGLIIPYYHITPNRLGLLMY